MQIAEAAEAAAAAAAAAAGVSGDAAVRAGRLGARWPLRLALSLFEAAAAGRHEFAMYNLGVAHLYGFGTRRDAPLAGRWFAASGLPEGYMAVALQQRGLGHDNESRRWEGRARHLGFGTPWRKVARATAGTGGIGGIPLHSAWPGAGGGEGPPDW